MAESQNEEINKEAMSNEIKTISQTILEKHLMGRKFDKSKVKKWGNLIIDEIHKIISDKYPEYGFCIFFYMSDVTAYVSNTRKIFYENSDISLLSYYYTDDFYSEIRIFATKKYRTISNFSDITRDKELSSKINKKISDHLEGRTYEHEIFKKVIENIVKDINEILLARDNKTVSYHIGYINELPARDIYFYYKFFNFEIYPLFFNYKNNSFACRVYLFLINN